jgi:hypothetical protein
MNRDDGARRQGVPEMPRPKEHLIAFRKRYPHAFKLVDALRVEPGRAGPEWPEWCFLPFEVAYWMLHGKGLPESPAQAGAAFELAALAAWRVTQGIYRLAPKLFDEAWEADLDWKIPADLFFRLPRWCVYIETHGEGPMGMRCACFFAHLITDSPRTAWVALLCGRTAVIRYEFVELHVGYGYASSARGSQLAPERLFCDEFPRRGTRGCGVLARRWRALCAYLATAGATQ